MTHRDAYSLLLVVAHILVTIVFNISPLWLRLASVAIPVLFGFGPATLLKKDANTEKVTGTSAGTA